MKSVTFERNNNFLDLVEMEDREDEEMTYDKNQRKRPMRKGVGELQPLKDTSQEPQERRDDCE